MPEADSGIPRRTIRVPDTEWAAGIAAAEANGEKLSEVIRRAIAAYAMGQAANLAAYQTEYRATSKIALHGTPEVVTGIVGDLDSVKQIYQPAKWTIDERDVSPYRPAKRRR